MKPLFSGLCAFAVAALLGVSGAQAFTITSNNGSSGGSGDGSAQFGDPPKINNDPISHFGSTTDPDGSQRSTFKAGNTTFSFGLHNNGWANGAGNRNDGSGYNAMTGRQLFFGQ